ncbi:hypothetical protein ABZ871_10995 [Streptomyces populi]
MQQERPYSIGLLQDPDVKLRTWAGRSAQRRRPSPVVHGQDTEEMGELLDRSRRLFSDYVPRRRKWEVGPRG